MLGGFFTKVDSDHLMGASSKCFLFLIMLNELTKTLAAHLSPGTLESWSITVINHAALLSRYPHAYVGISGTIRCGVANELCIPCNYHFHLVLALVTDYICVVWLLALFVCALMHFITRTKTDRRANDRTSSQRSLYVFHALVTSRHNNTHAFLFLRCAVIYTGT